MNQALRVGVLGTGRITRRLVADLQSTDDIQVNVIGSRMMSRAKWSADQYGIGAAEGSYEAVIARDDVDALYIATTPDCHAALAIAAAKSGKSVLCEKPLSTDLETTMKIHHAFEDSEGLWMDATAWLYHERSEAFWKWIDEGRLGRLSHISASVSFYRPFQTDDHRLLRSMGGGCRLDLGWYAAGLIVRAGGMPKSLHCQAVMEDQVEIRCNAMMSCANDMTATLSCGYDAASRKWFEVAGSEASLICDDFTRPWPDRPARCWIHDASGAVHSETFDDSQERRMIESFRDAIAGKTDDLSGRQMQCLRTASVLDAMDHSRQSGGMLQDVAEPRTAKSI